MWQYLVKRFTLLILTLVGICVLSFVIVTRAPGDPTLQMLGLTGEGKGKAKIQSLDQAIENTRRALYLDRPAVVNFTPNSRTRIAENIAQRVVEGAPGQRKVALAELRGEAGTAALAELVSEAPGRAE